MKEIGEGVVHGERKFFFFLGAQSRKPPPVPTVSWGKCG
jgi:hypothetical protein